MKGMRLLAAGLLFLILWTPPALAADRNPNPFTFPAMDGWTLAGQPQTFSPDTLYDYIDGGSDLYLKYEFEGLQVVEYRKDKMSVSAEVYRHRDPDHAFGIYSQERVPSAEFLAIGAQGYYEAAVCNFIQGGYYVKLTSENAGADDRDILLRFARRISERLPNQSTLPEILSAFPAEGKKPNSEKFIAKDFLGYGFLHAGFTADYERSGQTYQLFVIAGDSPDDARTMLGRYLKQIKHEGNLAEGAYQLTDPYHAELALFWKGKYIWGTMNLADPSLRAAYLKQFERISDLGLPLLGSPASTSGSCADPMAVIKTLYDANDANNFNASLALFTEDATLGSWAEGINGHHMNEVHLTGKVQIRAALGKPGLRRISERPGGPLYHEAKVEVSGDRVTFMLEPDRLRPNGKLYSPYHVEVLFVGCKIRSLTVIEQVTWL